MNSKDNKYTRNSSDQLKTDLFSCDNLYIKERVEPLPHPRHKAKDFSVPKTPNIPKEPTEEELTEQEKNLEKLWKHVHGHKLETAPPKKKKAKIIKY